MKYQIIKILIIGLLLFQFACESKKITATADTEQPSSTEKTTVAEQPKTEEEKENVDKGTPTAMNAVEDFVPEGYQVRAEVAGSLNGDDKEDVVLVLQKKQDVEANRIVVLLVKKETGYEKVAENDKAILCQECGGVMGDPFQKVVVKDDFFTIEHFGGSADRWARYSTFRYDGATQDWRWHKDATVLTSAHDLKFEKTQKMQTDNRSFVNFEIENE